MEWQKKKSRSHYWPVLLVGLFVLTGTYNAVVINSESHLTSADFRFVKRLDEMYGVTIAGRDVAASASWKKIQPVHVTSQLPKKLPSIVQTISKVDSAPDNSASFDNTPQAAVQEELNLTLVEVINPKKWAQGLPSAQFNGSLATSGGQIDDLSVSLPNEEAVSVVARPMNGNVFEYDYAGEIYSAMMYQVDQNSYMVTFSNGPLEGTRLRFAGSPQVAENYGQPETVAEAPAQDNFGNIEVAQLEQENQQLALQEQLQQQQAAIPLENAPQMFQQAEQANEQGNAQFQMPSDQEMQQQAAQAQNMNQELPAPQL